MSLPDEVILIVCSMRRQILVKSDHDSLKAAGIVTLKHRMKVPGHPKGSFFSGLTCSFWVFKSSFR